jgi:hypothetical protein
MAGKRRSSALTVVEINGGTAIWSRSTVKQTMSTLVRIAKSHLLHMEIKKENTVLTSAT